MHRVEAEFSATGGQRFQVTEMIPGVKDQLAKEGH
jgi:hypothetical protein